MAATAGVFALLAYKRLAKAAKKRAMLRNNHRIVVTGSTHGLGLALIRAFLKLSTHSNIRVVINGRSQEGVAEAVAMLRKEFADLVEQDDKCISGFSGDVSSVEDMNALAANASAAMGSITHWINNAGINQEAASGLLETSAEEIQRVIQVNLLGSILASQAAMRAMESQSSGHIFLMEGNGSRQNPTPMSVAYGASKAALPQVTPLPVSPQFTQTALQVHQACCVGRWGPQHLPGHDLDPPPGAQCHKLPRSLCLQHSCRPASRRGPRARPADPRHMRLGLPHLISDDAPCGLALCNFLALSESVLQCCWRLYR